MNIHKGRELTDQVITALTTAGLTVGDAVAPTSISAGAGYVVVYPLLGGDTDGTIGNPNDDASIVYQLTSVGADRRQCEWVADKARETILAAAPTLTNRKVTYIDVDMLGGVQRDDDVQPPTFYCPERYRIRTTPT